MKVPSSLEPAKNDLSSAIGSLLSFFTPRTKNFVQNTYPEYATNLLQKAQQGQTFQNPVQANQQAAQVGLPVGAELGSYALPFAGGVGGFEGALGGAAYGATTPDVNPQQRLGMSLIGGGIGGLQGLLIKGILNAIFPEGSKVGKTVGQMPDVPASSSYEDLIKGSGWESDAVKSQFDSALLNKDVDTVAKMLANDQVPQSYIDKFSPQISKVLAQMYQGSNLPINPPSETDLSPAINQAQQMGDWSGAKSLTDILRELSRQPSKNFGVYSPPIPSQIPQVGNIIKSVGDRVSTLF